MQIGKLLHSELWNSFLHKKSDALLMVDQLGPSETVYEISADQQQWSEVSESTLMGVKPSVDNVY